MFREVKKRAFKAGHPPGSLLYTGKEQTKPTSITVVTFNPQTSEEITANSWEECLPLIEKNDGMSWVNIEGLQDISVIEKVAKQFHLHSLTVEDILNVEQRPKVEEFDGYIYITVKVLDWRSKSSTFSVKQLSIVLGKNFILSFHEVDTTRFDDIRKRLHNSTNQRLREQGCDYLAYRLIDSIVDEYFLVLETLGEKIETLEEAIVDEPTPQNARTIYRLKRKMLFLRKIIWPMREAISHLMHEENDLISRYTQLYLRDVYDHAVQAIDTLETFRDMLSNMIDMYLSSMTSRMNEIMKTLTIITTIFIPITSIASIYGMNFTFMPGLHWYWGYAVTLGIMGLTALSMLLYYKEKGWI